MGMQAVYNSTSLDNGTWRRIHGQVGDSTSVDRVRYVTIEFTIEADTASSLQTRYNATLDSFLVKNSRFTFTLDDTNPGDYLIDIYPNQGRWMNVVTAISTSPSHHQTGHSLYLVLTVATQLVFAGATAADATDPTIGPFGPPLAGAQGDIAISKIYSAGRIQARSLQVVFQSTFDETARGPFTISSVESGTSSKARFVFSGSPSLGSFTAKETVTLQVSSSTAYNGDHIITGIDDDNDKVQTMTAFGATDTGTAYIGVKTPAQDNYDTARASLLTMLGVGANGARDETTGMTLVGETVVANDSDDSTINVTLTAEYQPSAFTNTTSARGCSFTISRQQPDRWDKAGGATPMFYKVSGFFDISSDTDAGGTATDPMKLWSSQIQPDVLAALTESSDHGTGKLLSLILNKNAKDNRLFFEATYQTRNSSVLSYSQSLTWQSNKHHVLYANSNGKYSIQRPPTFAPMIVTKSITRVSTKSTPLKVGLLTTDAPRIPSPPVDWVPLGDPSGSFEGPIDTAFGTVYVQAASQSYERADFEKDPGALFDDTGVQVV